MTLRMYCSALGGFGLGALFVFSACSGEVSGSEPGGASGSASGAGGSTGPGGSSIASGGSSAAGGASGATGTGGAAGSAGSATADATGAGGSTGAGGTAVVGGASGAGGTTGVGGAAGLGGAGGAGGGGTATPPPPLDCGPIGTAIENAGPPANRVNYVILADGYTSTTVGTTLTTDINAAMAARFSDPFGQPYLRYRKFVNICLYRTVSQNDGIGNGATIFSCTGDDASRLANCNTNLAQQQLTANTPAGFMVDWHSIVLNNSAWWNTGSVWMLWSGGNPDGPKAALHEGGHGFHQLADEYGATASYSGTTSDTREYNEVDMTADATMTAGKWPAWLGFNQMWTTPQGAAQAATGLQGAVKGGRYVDNGQFRPSGNSMMNSLFGTNPNTSFNAVSREKMIMDIWRFVTPVDSAVPAAGAVANPVTLTVNVIDPAVINVDWSVDGAVVAANGGVKLDVAARNLTPGTHTITAKAYDNADQDLVRQITGTTFGRMNWARSQQTITWTVTVP